MKWLKKVAATPLTSIARVVDSLQNQTNDRTNAPSIRVVNEAINKNWLTIYPIGSIYMSVKNVDPSTIFGGTWEQIKDRFLLAAGDIYTNSDTGGEATHILTINEMPSHKHTFGSAPDYRPASLGESQYYAGTEETDTETTATGGGQPHNNMPPYLVVNIWVRRA